MERLRILLNQMVSEKTADVFLNEIRNRPPVLLVKLVQERESLNSLLNQIGISPGLDRVGVITALEIWSKEYVKKEQGPLAIEKEEKQRSMAIIEKEEEQGPLAIEKEEEQGSMAIIEKEEEKSLGTDEIDKSLTKDEENVENWSLDQVFAWAKNIVGEKYAKMLRTEEVNGKALLKQTKADLKGYGFVGGPATNLFEAIQELKTSETQEYLEDNTLVSKVMDVIAQELSMNLYEHVDTLVQLDVTRVADLRNAFLDPWQEWNLPPVVVKKLKEKIGFVESSSTIRQRFLITLQNRLGESTQELSELLSIALKKGNVILDEIQHLYLVANELITEIIQLVEVLKPSHSLILCGTPRFGEIDVLFEENTRGRLIVHVVPTWSALEIYALLLKLYPDIPFDFFLSLWSCFDGIPGLYEQSFNAKFFTRDSLNIEKIFSILAGAVILSPGEMEWIEKSAKEEGYLLSPTEESDCILRRIITLGAITETHTISGNYIFLRDKVLRAIVHSRPTNVTLQQRLSNMKGYGLETMVASIGKYICKYLNIQDADMLEEVSLGYGKSDVDLVLSDPDSSLIVCFSCKVNPYDHVQNFYQNIELHMQSKKPKVVCLVLCSSGKILGQVLHRFKGLSFSWNPQFLLFPADLSVIIPYLYAHNNFKFYSESPWPLLERPKQSTDLTSLGHRLIHIRGHRRVGKTELLNKIVKENDIYIDSKLLPRLVRMK